MQKLSREEGSLYREEKAKQGKDSIDQASFLHAGFTFKPVTFSQSGWENEGGLKKMDFSKAFPKSRHFTSAPGPKRLEVAL